MGEYTTYRYQVEIGSDLLSFSNVTGLEPSNQNPNAPLNISLKQGIAMCSSQLVDWIKSSDLNRSDKRNITINYTNEAGTEVLVSWNISNALPMKVIPVNLDPTSELIIDEFTISAERLTMQFH